MAIASGVKGTVNLPAGYDQSTGNIHCFGWRLDLTQDMVETTAWDGSGSNPRTYIGGMATGTGSCDVFFDSASAITLDLLTENKAAAAFVLTATTSMTYTFNGIVTGVNVESSKAGLFQGSIDFQVSGDVALAQPA